MPSRPDEPWLVAVGAACLFGERRPLDEGKQTIESKEEGWSETRESEASGG